MTSRVPFFRRALTLTALAALLTSPVAPALAVAAPPAPRVLVSGTMRDFETGEPLTAGEVAVRGQDGAQVATIGVEAGHFSATLPLRAGETCTLSYTSTGYQPDASTVRVDGDDLRVEPELVRTGVTTAVRHGVATRLALASSSATSAPPATIRVYRSALARVDVVGFDFYCKHVLPKEWYATWPADSLKAGAAAVRSYAWFWVAAGGKWPTLGADVKDTTADQVYDPAVSAASTDAAVDAVSDWRLLSGGSVLQAQYIAGSPGEDRDPAYPTRLSQWGTKLWAGLGFDWRWIVQHYYPSAELRFDASPARSVRFTSAAGRDRYGTAVAISQHAYAGHAESVVLAYGGDFPDALCAAPLADAAGGPVLLTRTAALDTTTAAELERLAPHTVYLIGSERSVSASVAARCAAVASRPAVKRLGGADRYATSALVAAELRAQAGPPARVIVASGTGFADALSSAPLAAAKGWPILLTRPAALPAVTAEAVKASGATRSLVVGSEKSVAKAVYDALPSPYRAGGADRYETCALVADFAVAQGCGYGQLALTTGRNFPDALAAGPMVAAGSPGLVFLAPAGTLPAGVVTRIGAHRTSVSEVHLVGTPASLSADAVEGAVTALR